MTPRNLVMRAGLFNHLMSAYDDCFNALGSSPSTLPDDIIRILIIRAIIMLRVGIIGDILQSRNVARDLRSTFGDHGFTSLEK